MPYFSPPNVTLEADIVDPPANPVVFNSSNPNVEASCVAAAELGAAPEPWINYITATWGGSSLPLHPIFFRFERVRLNGSAWIFKLTFLTDVYAGSAPPNVPGPLWPILKGRVSDAWVNQAVLEVGTLIICTDMSANYTPTLSVSLVRT